VAYARDRGIRVVPEFDIPGHTTSWLVGYPELASAPGPYSIGRTWGVFDGAMDPTREETYDFLDAFLAEMTQLFPDPYFHIGGDEVNGKQWSQSSSIQAFAKKHNLDGTRGLQVYFNQRIQKLLQKYGKIMVGWDEVLHPDLPADTVVQSWRGQASLAEAASRGYRGILSAGYYLDHLRPASYHYGIDPLADAAQKIAPEEASRILGGEACMWAEYANAETVDSRIWPRAAAIAERLWSPKDAADRFGSSAMFMVTIWSLVHAFRETHAKLKSLVCRTVLPSASLRWKFSNELLPDYCQDLPHKLYEQADEVRAAAKLWADDESRSEYLKHNTR